MSVFQLALDAHILIGTVVLVSFWTAALAAKGGTVHRRAGRAYVLAMAALLAVTLVMTAGMVLDGDPRRAMFNVYVSLISVVSVWIAWSSVAFRGDIRRYLGWPYKLSFGALLAYGLFVLSLAPRMPDPARSAMVAAFAVLGLSIAAAMGWRLVKRNDSPRWWLAEHLTGMGINFAATHASFSILAGGSVFPALKEPWVRTGILVAWMCSALVVRLWAGRRFLGGRATGKLTIGAAPHDAAALGSALSAAQNRAAGTRAFDHSTVLLDVVAANAAEASRRPPR
jgi:hypothetical protein